MFLFYTFVVWFHAFINLHHKYDILFKENVRSVSVPTVCPFKDFEKVDVHPLTYGEGWKLLFVSCICYHPYLFFFLWISTSEKGSVGHNKDGSRFFGNLRALVLFCIFLLLLNILWCTSGNMLLQCYYIPVYCRKTLEFLLKDKQLTFKSLICCLRLYEGHFKNLQSAMTNKAIWF